MISVQGVAKLLGKKDLFREVSFHVHPGDRIGVVGPNGAGKTTLFHILTGELEPDVGAVQRSRNLRLGYLPQQWNARIHRTVLAHTLDVHSEVQSVREELAVLHEAMGRETDRERLRDMAAQQAHLLEKIEHLGGYDLEARGLKILHGLGLRDDQLDRPVAALSGGWVMRLELARLLLSEPDVLLLDEPTNHLDLESLLWLESFLLSTRSAFLIISHDRAFLNRVVNRIFELEQGRFEEYRGNYDRYLEEKTKRREIRAAAQRNQEERVRQLERFIARNRYRKDRARQVQSRLKTLDKMERVEAPEEEAGIRFEFPEPARSGRRVVELHGVHKAYGDHVVYRGVDLVLERGDRVAFLGPNGAGKSTLLKILAGVESVDRGERKLGHGVELAYYAQNLLEQLNPELTVLEEALQVSGDLPQSRLRSLLGAFLFRGDDVTKPVAVLSGGEKARLTLCKLLLQRPNLLLLDEPTNHLDIPSREVLETALERFSGTVCFISHDRHFINAVADKILVVRSGKVELLPGNYDDYERIWKSRLDAERPEDGPGDPGTDTAQERVDAGRTDRDRKRVEAEWRNEWYRIKQPMEQRIAVLESRLEEAQARLEALESRLSDPSTYEDGDRVRTLQIDYQRCRKEIDEISRCWEEEALKLEALEREFWENKEGIRGRWSAESGNPGIRFG